MRVRGVVLLRGCADDVVGVAAAFCCLVTAPLRPVIERLGLENGLDAPRGQPRPVGLARARVAAEVLVGCELGGVDVDRDDNNVRFGSSKID